MAINQNFDVSKQTKEPKAKQIAWSLVSNMVLNGV